MPTEYIDSAQQLVDAINATGGVVVVGPGQYAPLCDPDWIDLGLAYISACSEKGLLPVVRTDELDEDGDDTQAASTD